MAQGLGLDRDLQLEVERFLYDEAALLDERRFWEWLELFTDDVRYWMPLREAIEACRTACTLRTSSRSRSWTTTRTT